MNYVEQEVVVQGGADEGPGAGVRSSGDIFRQIGFTVKPCVSMALTGRSGRVGQPPKWLQLACNVRVLGFSRRDADLVLNLASPALGDAAPRVFEQAFLWEQNVRPEETALELMGKLVSDVRAQQANSDAYDEPMLTRLTGWEGLLDKKVKSLILPGRTQDRLPVLDRDVIVGAKALNSRIPAPRQVRVVGTVDMVRHSTRSIGLRLANGDEVRCAVVDESIAALGQLVNREVTVLGKAIYRPSGTVLRLDVEAILDSVAGREQFGEVPLSFDRRQQPERRPQTARSGVAAIIGIWPGDETDEELLASLAEMRG